MTDINEFIGKGIKFPFIINSNGAIPIVTGLELINFSINEILSWPKNLRFFNESFGSRTDELLEEPSDNITRALVRTFIIDTINKYEKRVKLINILIPDNITSEKINITIRYNINNTKVEGTFIFPFYREINI